MLIQEQMGAQKPSCFIIFILLLCTLAAGAATLVTGEIDEDMAELLWVNCGLDLIHMKEAIGDLGLCGPEEVSCSINDIISKSFSWEDENVRKAMSVLHPQMKQILFDCLRKKNILLHVSGKVENSKNWYTMNRESLFPRRDAHKQYLGRELLQSITETPVPSPAPAPAPAPASGVGSPIFSSAQVPESQNPVGSPLQPFSPPDTTDSKFQPPAGPDSSSNVQANKRNTSHKSVVVAVAVTASVTLVFAVLCFLCCRKFCGTGSAVGRNDERPLLNLSLSDFSSGSAHNSFYVGNSIDKEKFSNESLSSNSSHNQKVSSLDGNLYIESDFVNASRDKTSSLESISETAKSSDMPGNINAQVLPLPPGRVGPGLLPLKPPAGRADPPSPVPPPPGKAGPPPPPPVPPPSLKPSGRTGPTPPGPPPPPPKPPGIKPGPRPPPPPPKSGAPPPRPPQPMAIGSKVPRPPPGPSHSSNTASGDGIGIGGETDAPRAKLKPFFWDKVLANPDDSMVWHQIKSGSFQFNEEMIETLFGYAPTNKNKNEHKQGSSSQEPSTQYIQIIESKKSQNIAILLRALNVTTEEVCDALLEGNELPSELLQTLLKMAPTPEEELKLRLFNGELSRLGTVERFLKALVDIPFSFKRLESLLFMSSLQEEVLIAKESLATLEVACKELRNSRLFLKLLEAVLKTGNRMNDGTFRGGAQAFKLDTLLKLADVKGTDGKTTLLHFVVQEIIRSEGVRAARIARESRSFSSVKSDDLLEDTPHESEEDYRNLGLQVVSGLGGELQNVKKAAILDADSLIGTVAKLGRALVKTRDFLNSDMKSLEQESGFHQTLKSFVQNAEIDIMWLLEEEKRIMTLVKSTGDYFHGHAGKEEGLHLFVIVRDFLIMLDKACREVRESPKRPTRTQNKEAPTAPPSSSDPRQPPSPDVRQRLFPAIIDRRMDYSSSDDETP